MTTDPRDTTLADWGFDNPDGDPFSDELYVDPSEAINGLGGDHIEPGLGLDELD